MNEEKTYEVTLRKEVLMEFAASIKASFVRYFIKNDIDEFDEVKKKEDPIVKKYWSVVEVRNRILGSRYYRDLEGLKTVDQFLREAKEFIDNLED